MIELTLFLGGENTPFTRESFIKIIESEANYCNSSEQAKGCVSRYNNFDEHGKNGLTYLANNIADGQALHVNGITKASMPAKN